MADNLVIKATIKAKDLLSRPVVQMAGTLRTRLGPAFRHAREMAKNAEKRIKCVGSALGRIGRFASGIARVGAILGGFAGFSFRGIIKAGDDLATLSDKAGIAAETLEELRFAAKKSDVEAATFDKGIINLNKNMGLLKSNTGRLNAFLEKTSPTLQKQLQAANGTGEAFDILIAAMSKLPDTQRRAALANAAFGATDIALMAKNGAEGITSLREEARRYGIMSQKQAESSAQADDALINLKQAIVGVGNAIGGKVIPILIPLIKRLTEWVVANRELIATKVETFINNVVTAIRNIDWDAIKSYIGTTIDIIKTIVGWLGGWGTSTIILASIFSGVLTPALGLGVEALKGVWKISKGLWWLGGKLLPLAWKLLAKTFTKILIPAAKAVGTAFLRMAAYMMANPIILIIAAIAIAIAALVYVIYKNWEPIKAFFIRLWAAVVDVFWASVEWIKGAMQPVIEFMKFWWETIKGVFSGVIDFIAGVFTGDLDRAFGGVKQIFKSVSDYILRVWDIIKKPIMAVGGWLGMGGANLVVNASSAAGAKNRAPQGYSAPIPSSMPRAALTGGTENSFNGELRVKVESAAGVKASVDGIKSNNRDMNIFANVGRRSFATGGV